MLWGCSDGTTESPAVDRSPIIYGTDDRLEPFMLTPGSVAAQAASLSAAVMDSATLDTSNPSHVLVSAETLRERFGLCSGERFAEQITAATCSATLIAPDLVLTAGHCVSEDSCPDQRFVFGYRQSPDGNLAPLTANDVYGCAQVVARTFLSDIDYAIVRLDRALDRELPKLKVGGLALNTGEPLLVAGHPSGLPLKLTNGAKVVDPRRAERDFFLSDIDSFPGNSGSGVFDTLSGELVGVLVRGPNPGYEQRSGESCFRPEQATAQSPFIESVYLQQALRGYCRVASDPRLCACGDGRCASETGETTASCPEDCGQRCGDGECNGSEDGDACYQDCGECGNARCETRELARLDCVEDCGCPPGTIRDGVSCVAAKGNINGDAKIDAEDVRALDSEVCVSSARDQTYFSAADVDCNQRVDAADRDALADFVAGRSSALPCDRASGLALGAQHTCALLMGGRVRCWGANHAGQLGIGNTRTVGDDEAIASASLVELDAPVLQLAAGATHNCALLQDGRVRCWGEGSSGKLGLGDEQDVGDDEAPLQRPAVDLGGRATFVAAGGGHSCAILEGGDVRCWGDNQLGQLGTGQSSSVGDDEMPSALPALHFPAPIRALALGFDHTCALGGDGSVRCWGDNLFGQLGRGDPAAGGPLELATDVAPVELGGRAKALWAGTMTTCALREDDQLLCWGENFFGELGYPGIPIIGDDERPIDVGPVDAGPGLVELGLGQGRTCARYRGGEVRCWGDNTFGELGYGNALPLPVGEPPANLAPLPLGARASVLGVGSRHACAVTPDGTVRCWGNNESGQLGYGSILPVGASNTPAEAGDIPMTESPDARWIFKNPYQLQVWTKRIDDDHAAARVGLFVENRGGAIVRNWTAMLALSTAERPFASPLLMNQRTPWSVPSLERERTTLYALRYDFAGRWLLPGQKSSGGDRQGEWVRLAFANGRGFDVSNDYGMLDRSRRGYWSVTQRVQLVDESGAVIYGWSMR